MNSIKEFAKEAKACLTIAALTVAATGGHVFATAGEDGGGAVDEVGGSGATGRAEEGVRNVNPGAETDLEGMVKVILNTVFFVVGVVAVIMIIIGGVTYATSQGDTTKVQKGKNTILYGIVGLVVVLLSFAIVNFILQGLQGK